MSEHSPLPWKIDGANTSNFGSQIKTASKVKASRVACRLGGPDRDANAALIVRAVNAHAMLVAALEEIAGLSSTSPYPSSTPIFVARSILASLKESAS
jgi:hypothetical protein